MPGQTKIRLHRETDLFAPGIMYLQYNKFSAKRKHLFSNSTCKFKWILLKYHCCQSVHNSIGE
ncbi:hypothetical protein BRYFOR_07118 [Marvinbryantia formatexigens DSM 14469]|uniref:Uncharacterized protein n=1 Tax=Marvinbryantia formatexigens DSM 14469 TaxID=478749 RepID=C6LER7_9FIRM|nr:hypothetical protein BRYFOR_07118 [Marvinbryantia formatexigens DSM 14469]